jgi:transcriptional regulator with GAF, ATPase, and Fis domain
MTTTPEIHDLRLIGASAAIRAVGADIEAAARSDAKVLITGDTGVGKEVVARLIHLRSARRLARLATINCAGVPDSLLESELFGHVRGSFTGAVRDKAGLFEAAANGTTFLDEIGETSPRMQAVLLRFLETGELQRVGADRVHAAVNVRVIAATNRDLQREIGGGRFREDLYYRLNVIRIHVPPLRARREDIPVLLDHFLDAYSAHHRIPRCQISTEAADVLMRYSWPGNVRELKNVAERLVLKAGGETVGVAHLPSEFMPQQAEPLTAAVESAGVASGAPPDRAVVALVSRMLDGGESFWPTVHGPFMRRDLSRDQLRAIVTAGLERTSGSYRVMVGLFNMAPSDYKRFLGFLRKHECQVPFHSFRSMPYRRVAESRAIAS